MKIYPNIWTIIIVFQLAYIWFKGEPYFSWWLIAPIIALAILGNYIGDSLMKTAKEYIKTRKNHIETNLDSIKVRQRLMDIDLNLVQKFRRDNLKAEYDKPISAIGDAIRDLYNDIKRNE